MEHALRHHGPDDPALELQDILSTLVAEACEQLEQAKYEAQRAERKRRLLAFAKSTLTDAINECPAYLVGAFASEKRTHLTRAVWADLRPVLGRRFPGRKPKMKSDSVSKSMSPSGGVSRIAGGARALRPLLEYSKGSEPLKPLSIR